MFTKSRILRNCLLPPLGKNSSKNENKLQEAHDVWGCSYYIAEFHLSFILRDKEISTFELRFHNSMGANLIAEWTPVLKQTFKENKKTQIPWSTNF